MCSNEAARFVPPQVVEHGHVGVSVVEVVGVGWVVFFCPVGWQWTVKIENVVLRFGLIINAVETHHLANKQKKIYISGYIQIVLFASEGSYLRIIISTIIMFLLSLYIIYMCIFLQGCACL